MRKAGVGVLVSLSVALVLAVLFAAVLACTKKEEPVQPKPAGEKTYASNASWVETKVDVFPGMDGPNLNLDADDIKGRVVWNLWVGDTGLMWDYLAQHGFGTADLLKTMDSRGRAHRFANIGIINQPGFQTATKPDQYGLFIDEPKPGDPDGQIDTKIDYKTYGRSSGVVGLRISDNPKFDAAAQAEWKKHIAADGINHDYYENPDYFNNQKLVRPYVVGMACSFCHVGPDPVRPPADFENPKWENLNDYVGAQYMKVWAMFVPKDPKTGKDQEDSFVWQLIHSNPQGSLDTSFISSDNLNNPGTMNAVYSLGERVKRAAKAVGKQPAQYDAMTEYLSGGALNLRNLKDGIDKGTLVIPRVLKQGDDSVGLEGALSRVYLNIGEAWPEWSKHFRPLIGGFGFDSNNPLASQTPVEVATLQHNSAEWNWSEERSPALAKYLIKVAQPLLLKDAPGHEAYLKATPEQLNRGKIVFAENCARCHSSKQPAENIDPKSPAGTDWFRQQVQSDPNFFSQNFLADERRKPVTDIGTNATRAAATNAMAGHIWDNFSSQTYKTLPKVAAFQVENPFDASKPLTIDIPGNGPGYYRPPSLISLWSSAPYLHNNTVGNDFGDPSVPGRMRAFQDGIERMLLIKPRQHIIWRTTKTSYINIPMVYLPDELRKLIEKAHPELIDVNQNLRIGPIPAGTPINLISNVNLDAGVDLALKRIDLFNSLIDALVTIKKQNLNEAQATDLMKKNVVPKFLAVNKCPDFVEDKGHEFGTKLPMPDKLALIELLKTF